MAGAFLTAELAVGGWTSACRVLVLTLQRCVTVRPFSRADCDLPCGHAPVFGSIARLALNAARSLLGVLECHNIRDYSRLRIEGCVVVMWVWVGCVWGGGGGGTFR